MYNLSVKLPAPVYVENPAEIKFDDYVESFDKLNVPKNDIRTNVLKKQELEVKKYHDELAAKELLLKSQLLITKRNELQKQEEIIKLIHTVVQQISAFTINQAEYLQKFNTQITALAFAIAEKIIQKKIEVDKEFIVNIVKNALSIAQNEQEIIIQINSDDMEIMQQYLPELRANYQMAIKIELEAAPSVKKGGCIIKTSNGYLDAQIDSQLEAIEKMLIESFIKQ